METGTSLISRLLAFGKPLVKIAVILLILIAIGALTVTVFSRFRNDDNDDNGPEETRPTEIPGIFTIGEVVVTNTDLTRLLSTDTQTLPNCNGSSELKIARSISKTTETKLEFETSSSISAEIGGRIPLADLGAAITTAITETVGKTEGSTLEETTEVTMAAAPGTAVTYNIVWMEVFTAGVVEIIEKKGEEENHFFQEFIITSALRAEVQEPERSSCESD